MAASVKTENVPFAFNELLGEVYNPEKISDTLQGSIWRASTSNDTTIVIKLANKEQSNRSIAIVNNRVYQNISEDIVSEGRILKYLTQQSDCSPFITKFISFLETDEYFVLVEEDGGCSLFQFVRRAHQLVASGAIPMDHWHAVCKVITKQIVDAIAYIHSKNICHNDISLENFLINVRDLPVELHESGKMEIATDDIQIKLCDFGLAELHRNSVCLSNKHCGKRPYKSPEVINLKRNFSGKKNDIWSLGVCLFMLSYGTSPWNAARATDQRFDLIMNGKMLAVLRHWKLTRYIDPIAVNLLLKIFKYEEDRCTVSEIQSHPFYHSTL